MRIREEGSAGSGVERAEEVEMLAKLNFAALTGLLIRVKVGATGAKVAYIGA